MKAEHSAGNEELSDELVTKLLSMVNTAMKGRGRRTVTVTIDDRREVKFSYQQERDFDRVKLGR